MHDGGDSRSEYGGVCAVWCAVGFAPTGARIGNPDQVSARSRILLRLKPTNRMDEGGRRKRSQFDSSGEFVTLLARIHGAWACLELRYKSPGRPPSSILSPYISPRVVVRSPAACLVLSCLFSFFVSSPRLRGHTHPSVHLVFSALLSTPMPTPPHTSRPRRGPLSCCLSRSFLSDFFLCLQSTASWPYSFSSHPSVHLVFSALFSAPLPTPLPVNLTPRGRQLSRRLSFFRLRLLFPTSSPWIRVHTPIQIIRPFILSSPRCAYLSCPHPLFSSCARNSRRPAPPYACRSFVPAGNAFQTLSLVSPCC